MTPPRRGIAALVPAGLPGAVGDDGPAEDDLLATDRYLAALLEGRADPEAPVDPAIVRGALATRAALARVHPSFHFEERLAARLAALAAGIEPAAPARLVDHPAAIVARDPELAAILRGALDPAAGPPTARHPLAARAVARPVLTAGAAASAAVSIAGIAWLVLRALRAPRRPRDAAAPEDGLVGSA